MAETAVITPDDLPATPEFLGFGDNVVRLAEQIPQTIGEPPFVFEFAINPEESIDFTGAQSIAEISVPSAEGSILQSVGSEPLRIKWKGLFEDVFNADGTLIRRAVEDIRTLEDMRISGKTWIFRYLDINHLVKIKAFNYTPIALRGNLDRWRYDIELIKFYPNLGFQKPQSISTFIQRREEITAISTITRFFDTVNNVLTTVNDAVVSVSNFLLSPIRAVDGILQNVFDQLETTGELVNTIVANAALAVTTPQRILESVQQRIEFNITTVQQIQGNLTTIANVDQSIMIAFHDIEAQLKQLGKLPNLRPNPPVTHTVLDGDRIEDVADLFYSDFESWRPIADANNLVDPSTLEPGTILTIPV